jgi:hypothetical protein
VPTRVGAPINVTFGASFTVPSGANVFKASGIWYDGASQNVTAISGSRVTVDSLSTVVSADYMGVYTIHGRVNSSGSDTWTITKSAGFFSEGPTCQVQFYSVADNTNFVRQQQVAGNGSGPLTRAVNSTTTDLVDAWSMTDGGGSPSGAITGFTAVGIEQTTNADKSRVFQANSPGASSTSITGPNHPYVGLVIASIFDASSSVSHASSGALVGPGSSIVGSAARIRAHASSGELTGPGSSIAGSTNRTRAHAASGVLAGPGSELSGSASRTRAHGSSGDIVGPGAVLDGSAARARQHGSSGDLIGPGSAIAGSADHQGAAGTHDATGALVGPGSVVAGSAARTRAFAASGVLIGPGAVVAGAAERFGPAVSHDATGALVGQGALVSGQAQNGTGPGGPGFVLVDFESSMWWKRKPKAVPKVVAEKRLARVVKALDAVAAEQIEAGEPVKRSEVRQQIAPLLAEMPGFDWRPLYAAILQYRQAEAAGQEAAREIDRIRRLEQDEDDVLALLLSF